MSVHSERVAEPPGEGRVPSERVLLEAMPVGLVLSDPAGRIFYVNAELERITGYPRVELLGRNIELFLLEAIRVASHTRIRRQDGQVVEVDITSSQLERTDGALILRVVRDAARRDNALKLAVFEDRERIGDAMRNDVVHSLFSIGMSLQSTTAYLAGNEEAEKRVATIVEQLDHVIGRVRRLVFDQVAGGGRESDGSD